VNALQDRLRDYLALRRGLGFRLVEAECYLRDFCSFMKQERATVVTSSLALRWAMMPASARPTTWAGRLTVIRQFARYLKGFEPATEIPGTRLLPFRPKRCQPYLYSLEEIEGLMTAARSMPSRQMLKPHTVATLIGLLAVTGMRVNEALSARHEDIDLESGVITIRGSKFTKSRLVPLHPSTVQALREYATRRDHCIPRRWPRGPHFLLTGRGAQFAASEVHLAFDAISRTVGLRTPQMRRGPRLHDLRHRFATETLLRWSRAGVEIEREMPALTTYLGHSNLSDTYWYLSAHPELLKHAALRLQRRWGGSV
jgi:integrase/recombinase XerD